MRPQSTVFNLDLFLALNDEYKDKPIVPHPKKLGTSGAETAAKRRAAYIDTILDIRGKRILEIGCGRGAFSYLLAKDYGCDVVGVDIVEREWSDYRSLPGLDLRVLDISVEVCDDLEQFDLIYSSSVWEHMKHPYAALKAVKRLLKSDGHFFLSANLYRGPRASHRYREVHFPWPHLLFTDNVFEEFYSHIGKRPNRPAWVNKLTYSQYKLYFETLGFHAEDQWFSTLPFDEGFYTRFEGVLSRYPKTDLRQDFLNAVLVHRSTLGITAVRPTQSQSRIEKLATETQAERERGERLERELQALRDTMIDVERQLGAEKDKVHRMKNSIRWRLGTSMVVSVRRPWRLLRLPFELVGLVMDLRRRRANASA